MLSILLFFVILLLLASLTANVILAFQLRRDNQFLCKDGMFISNDPGNLKKMATCINSPLHCKTQCIDKQSKSTNFSKDCIDCLNMKDCGVRCNTDVSNFTCDKGIFVNNDNASLQKLQNCVQDPKTCQPVCKNSMPNSPPTPDCLKCLHTNDCGVTC